MNITILTNQKQYHYHNTIANQIKNILNHSHFNISVLDICSEKYEHLCLNKLEKLCPNILITFDLAGFNFPTQAGENALNMLTTKNLNLIWGNKKEYIPILSKKISLSMLFYDASGKDHALSQHYKNLEYYKVSDLFFINTVSPLYSDTEKAFKYIWEDFTKEVLIK